MRQVLVRLLAKSIQSGINSGVLPEVASPLIEVEWAKESAHGDYASNLAMVLASQARKNPREIAKAPFGADRGYG